MGELKTSYIFTKPEMLFLLSSVTGISPTYPMKYILNEYLSDSIASQEAVEGLEYKKLIIKLSGRVSLEPVIDLLVRSALSSKKLWIINENTAHLMIILKSKDMFLYIKSYPLINGAWRIAPYKIVAEMLHEFNDTPILSVKIIDDSGEKTCMTSPKDFTWLEE